MMTAWHRLPGQLAGADTAYSIQFLLGLAMLQLAIVALPAANAQDAQGLAAQSG